MTNLRPTRDIRVSEGCHEVVQSCNVDNGTSVQQPLIAVQVEQAVAGRDDCAPILGPKRKQSQIRPHAPVARSVAAKQ